ncbi:PA2169 family four-helix-bundle protein [Sulfitobacter sp. S190]|uniref:ferritin-like domain-containing protein n=1 Tax=Sulfitobacter sp. S190 TaxID=2867022 RepID=UPI0021A78623|nr:PA2169 family four-helix-bundle protein [Sulfitobacter sp. S190]UWR21195.1 PA2169 family four-helix-bundle protein [Sulfitobacter sp. S190]
MKTETDALSDLYTTLIDSRDGYEQAAELIDTPRLKSLFEDMQSNRARQAEEVRAYLSDANVELDDDGTLLAAAHRNFLSLREFVSNDDEDIVEEVIRGERQLLDMYDEAIRPMDGDSDAYRFAKTQYEALAERINQLEEEERRLDIAS